MAALVEAARAADAAQGSGEMSWQTLLAIAVPVWTAAAAVGAYVWRTVRRVVLSEQACLRTQGKLLTCIEWLMHEAAKLGADVSTMPPVPKVERVEEAAGRG